MYVYWYSILHSILLKKLGTLNPVAFNYTAFSCLLCFFLRFASRTLPKWDWLPSRRACLPAQPKGTLWIRTGCRPVPGLSQQRGRSGARLARQAAARTAVAMGGRGNGRESRLLGNCSKVAGLLSQGTAIVVQRGACSLVKNTVNLTLGCRQGGKRRKETWMHWRTQKEEWGLTL